MSMNFKDDMNDDARNFMKEFLGDVEIVDNRTALFSENEINQKKMSELARLAKQPVTVELHGEGEIKELADGTKYQVTKDGWRKVED